MESKWEVGNYQKVLDWYELTPEPGTGNLVQGLSFDPDCTAVDKCGILLSMENPGRRHKNFWPLERNYWPEVQVKKINNDEGLGFIDM